VTSQSADSSHSEIRTGSTIRVKAIQANTIVEHCVRTLGEEAFGETYTQVKIANNHYCCSSMRTRGSLKAQQRASQFVYQFVLLYASLYLW